MVAYELVMYTRTLGCPLVASAQRILQQQGVRYRQVFIDRDPQAREYVLAWTGFLAVPTLVVTEPGAVTPVSAPTPLLPGASPRGIDRGTMITEPGEQQLLDWLSRHGFVSLAAGV
jgi:glutaredoxin